MILLLGLAGDFIQIRISDCSSIICSCIFNGFLTWPWFWNWWSHKGKSRFALYHWSLWTRLVIVSYTHLCSWNQTHTSGTVAARCSWIFGNICSLSSTCRKKFSGVCYRESSSYLVNWSTLCFIDRTCFQRRYDISCCFSSCLCSIVSIHLKLFFVLPFKANNGSDLNCVCLQNFHE